MGSKSLVQWLQYWHNIAAQKATEVAVLATAEQEMAVLKGYLLELAIRRKHNLVSDGERTMHRIYLADDAPSRISQAALVPPESVMVRFVEYYLGLTEENLAEVISQLSEMGWQ